MTVSVRDAGWNAVIAPGAATEIGFNARGIPPTRTDCSLDGVACTGQAQTPSPHRLPTTATASASTGWA